MPSYDFEPVEAVPTAVATDGRGGYDWTYEHLGFAMRRPLGINYMGDLEREPFAEVAIAHDRQSDLAKTEIWQDKDAKRTDGLSDLAYTWLARYTEGHLRIDPKLKLAVDGAVSKVGFDVSTDGKRLVTVGDKVRLWDIPSAQQLTEISVLNPKAAYFAGTEGDIVVQTQQELLRFSGEDYVATDEWRAPQRIATVHADRLGKTWAVVLEDLTLVALGKNFLKIDSLNSGRLSNDQVAVHPSGDWIMANSKAGPIRWYLDGLVHEPTVLGCSRYDPAETFCVSGVDVDFWVGPSYCHEQNVANDPASTALSDRLILPEVHHALACTVDQGAAWMLIVGRQPDQENKWRVFLQDQAPHEGFFSLPLPLDELPVQIAASDDGETVAISSDTELIVFPRRRWVDPYGDFTLNNLAKLPGEGKGDEFEICVDILENLEAPRANVLNATLASVAIFRAGNAWAQLELGQSGFEPDEAAERIRNYEDWRKQGSPIAVAASVVRASSVIWQLQDYERRQQIMEDYARDVQSLLKVEGFRRVAIELKVQHMVVIEQVEQSALNTILREYATSFPEALSAHASIAQYMQEGRLGIAADRFSYTADFANLFPSQHADFVYATLFLDVVHYTGYANKLLGVRQFHRGATEMMRRGSLASENLYPIERVYRNVADNQVLTDVREYGVRSFGNLAGNAYWLGIPETMLPIRDASRRMADELMGK